jgi:DNA-binding NarL/FixJ family response regulator
VLDDDSGWTASVRDALERVGRPVLEAANPPEALRLIGHSGSSLLVIGPRSAEGLDWVASARRAVADLHVIVVAADANADRAAAAFASGATAVITEPSPHGNLASALAVAAAGAPKPDRFGLSKKELEILELVTRGSSNAQIARALWVSEQTVKFHLSRIYKKLGVSSRTEAAWVARSEGLLPGTNAQTGSS